MQNLPSAALLGHFTDTDEPLTMTLASLQDQRILVAGQAGSGKSHTLRRLMEAMASLKMPLFVIDVEGDFTTLTDTLGSRLPPPDVISR